MSRVSSYIKTNTPTQMYREKLGHEVWVDLHAMVHFGVPLGPLMESVKRSYPCQSCRKHLLHHLAHDVPPMGKNEEQWLVDVHNTVNLDLGKPTKSYDYCATYDRYEERVRRLRSLPSYDARLQELHRAFQKLTMPSIKRRTLHA